MVRVSNDSGFSGSLKVAAQSVEMLRAANTPLVNWLS